MRLRYAIKFVADMDRATAFHQNTLGLALKFASPFWTEFETGDVTLALHPASDINPPGTVQLGYATDDLAGLYARRDAAGLTFSSPPTPQHGTTLARFIDSEGAECSVSG